MPSTSQSQSQQQRPKNKRTNYILMALNFVNFNNDTGCSRCMLNETHFVDDLISKEYMVVLGYKMVVSLEVCLIKKSFCCNKQVILCSSFVLILKQC